MKGFRFYADLPGTEYEPGEHGFPRGRLPRDMSVARLRVLGEAGIPVNCIALFTDQEPRYSNVPQEALVSVFAHADSGVCVGGVSHDYLRKCRRIPEALARALHPQLAQRLDA